MIARLSGSPVDFAVDNYQYDMIQQQLLLHKMVVLKIGASRYGAIRDAYGAYLRAGGDVVVDGKNTALRASRLMTKYVSATKEEIYAVLLGMVYASKKQQLFRDLLDPSTAKKRIDPNKPDSPVEKIVRDLAIFAVAITAAIIVSKLPKRNGA